MHRLCFLEGKAGEVVPERAWRPRGWAADLSEELRAHLAWLREKDQHAVWLTEGRRVAGRVRGGRGSGEGSSNF